MTKPSKQRPWVVEIQPPNIVPRKWFELEAYSTMEEAGDAATMAKLKAPETSVRISQWREEDQ